MFLSYCFKFFLFLVCYFSTNYSSLSANIDSPFVSAVIVNENNNEKIYSYNADQIIYPASLTKIMTAYIVFDAIKEGIISINDVIDKKKYKNFSVVNSAPYDQTITIYDLLIKMIVKSSNESAIILAMEVANEEKLFVSLMNKKAKSIGMHNTFFVNSHGLYNDRHVSTANDLVKLTISFVKSYPEMSKIFNIVNYIDNNDNFEEKTTTIDRVKNIKGSKTGFISAIGYNIALWGLQNGIMQYIVIIGCNSKYDRDRIALFLMNYNKNNILYDENIINIRNNNDIDILKYIKYALNFIGIDIKDKIKLQDKVFYSKNSKNNRNGNKKNNRFYYMR